ncbi:Phosphotransferase enzyme family protein [Anaeromicropila populeti]|uniref:Phosphotransferase enzyme family protein n=2 Tax=Anaeromicropila populeti TaxID=37658 RepID=A0A1I6HT97_9FIRM|nr:Phosphotransferase enzyme family protein [Anaeromicropila populeti]
MLNISEKTVSKWECGNGLPEVVYMLPLCNILGITVNELLAGEYLHIEEFLQKMDISRLELMKQLEFEQLKMLMYKLYGLEVDSMEISDKGAGSLTYFVNASEKKYVIKYASDNNMNNPELEPKLCEYLRENGIPACEFIKNLQGRVISTDENGRRFHVQKFIEGITYSYNEATDFLLKEAAEFLSKIHLVLKDYEELPDGIGTEFFQYRTPESTLISYENSLQMALQSGDYDNAEDIRNNIEILKRFTNDTIDISELSCGNTHGDFMISQILCDDYGIIKGIIDWTTACRHPYVWEIVRSYVFMAPECKHGEINMDKFEVYLKTYLNKGKLKQYDMENAGKMFFQFLAVCDFYGQYYHSLARNRHVYLQQAKLSAKLLKWFEQHIDELTNRLNKIATEM